MTIDLTTNRVQFKLLTADEQNQMKAWPHGWYIYSDQDDEWKPSLGKPYFLSNGIYRTTPAGEPA